MKVIDKGFKADIFKSINMTDSDTSNNGISNRFKEVIIIGKNVPELDAIENITNLVILINEYGYKYLKPFGFPDYNFMFGGSFVYSNDSRFRNISNLPIPFHDRTEN